VYDTEHKSIISKEEQRANQNSKRPTGIPDSWLCAFTLQNLPLTQNTFFSMNVHNLPITYEKHKQNVISLTLYPIPLL